MMHMKEDNNLLKKGKKNPQNLRWRHVDVEIQDGRYFCKILYFITDPWMYIYFEPQKCYFLNIFLIPGGICPPQNPAGEYFCHPSKSKWEVPRNNLHHLANG